MEKEKEKKEFINFLGLAPVYSAPGYSLQSFASKSKRISATIPKAEEITLKPI
jgi:hypothetical protein